MCLLVIIVQKRIIVQLVEANLVAAEGRQIRRKRERQRRRRQRRKERETKREKQELDLEESIK